MKAKHTQTRTTALALMALLLAPLPALHADNPPALIEPADQAALTMSIPHFQWQRLLDAKPEAMPSYDIEIASDKEFAKVVDKDRIAAVIGWYVPDKELAPGAYWWRVAGVDARGAAGPWAVARTFSVKKPERVIEIKNNATFADIQKTFAEAAARAPVVVKFEKGVYRLDPGAARQFIAFKDVNDLTIDGGGATIVFTHPVEWVDLRNCRRVLVKNFILDFDPPAYTAGRVVAVDSKAGRIEAEILPGHALPDAWPVFDRDRKGMIVTESDGFAMKRDVQLVVSHAGFERLEGRRFRFRFENGKTAALFSIGDIYVLDPRWLGEGGGHGLFVAGGEDVVFFNLTIRSAANECLGSFYAGRHAILHVRLERQPGRALSVNNGGNNHHNARTGPWIEGCLFENCGDDVCHVNGYTMSVATQPATDRLVINLGQPYDQYGVEARLDMRAGDRLLFYQRDKGRLLAEAKVVSSTLAPAKRALEVVTDRPIQGIVTGQIKSAKGANYAVSGNTEVTEVYNASRICNQFVFRHNIARNSRRVGVLAKGDGGLIEDNTFESLGGGGVEFWNAPFEGLAAENYVVRGNKILNCGRLKREHAAVWATIFKTGGDKLQRNLLISGNEIIGFPGPAIWLRDAQNAVVSNNSIAPAPPFAPGKSRVEPITLDNTSAVRLEKNIIKEPKP